MINAILEFFDTRIRRDSSDEQPSVSEHALQLATASLLVEMTRANNQVTDEERQALDLALREVFDLDDEETRELVRLAELELQDSASLFQFTHLIDKEFSMAEKVVVIEMLWRIAYSDACKDKHEEYLVRKISELLHVPHAAFIRARHKAEQEAAG